MYMQLNNLKYISMTTSILLETDVDLHVDDNKDPQLAVCVYLNKDPRFFDVDH